LSAASAARAFARTSFFLRFWSHCRRHISRITCLALPAMPKAILSNVAITMLQRWAAWTESDLDDYLADHFQQQTWRRIKTAGAVPAMHAAWLKWRAQQPERDSHQLPAWCLHHYLTIQQLRSLFMYVRSSDDKTERSVRHSFRPQ